MGLASLSLRALAWAACLAWMPLAASGGQVCPVRDPTAPLPGTFQVRMLTASVSTAAFPGQWQEGHVWDKNLSFRLFVDGSGSVGGDREMQGGRVDFACDLEKRSCSYSPSPGASGRAVEAAKAIGSCLTRDPLRPKPRPAQPKPAPQAEAKPDAVKKGEVETPDKPDSKAEAPDGMAQGRAEPAAEPEAAGPQPSGTAADKAKPPAKAGEPAPSGPVVTAGDTAAGTAPAASSAAQGQGKASEPETAGPQQPGAAVKAEPPARVGEPAPSGPVVTAGDAAAGTAPATKPAAQGQGKASEPKTAGPQQPGAAVKAEPPAMVGEPAPSGAVVTAGDAGAGAVPATNPAAQGHENASNSEAAGPQRQGAASDKAKPPAKAGEPAPSWAVETAGDAGAGTAPAASPAAQGQGKARSLDTEPSQAATTADAQTLKPQDRRSAGAAQAGGQSDGGDGAGLRGSAAWESRVPQDGRLAAPLGGAAPAAKAGGSRSSTGGRDRVDMGARGQRVGRGPAPVQRAADTSATRAAEAQGPGQDKSTEVAPSIHGAGALAAMSQGPVREVQQVIVLVLPASPGRSDTAQETVCVLDLLPEEPPVARLQRLLLLAGQDPGPIDGKGGKRTVAALRAALGPGFSLDQARPALAAMQARLCAGRQGQGGAEP